MYESLPRDASFLHALAVLDEELATRTQGRGCPHCGAELDVADYPRKPRGGPWSLSDELSIRRSLCCRREGCRRRARVPSALFAGRRVYIGVVVVLGAVLRHGPSARRVTKLAEELDVDRRTLQRWRRWWLERFPKTTTWASLRARLMPPVDECVLPRSLVERFAGEHIIARISALLGHLAMDGEAPW